MNNRVVVAMSGGVDSSVAAALLQEQGYEVTGMMMHLWSEAGREDTNRCCTTDSLAVAREVATKLGMPFLTVDAREAFRSCVVGTFLEGYAAGETPNPCLTCNRMIRWGLLLEQALAVGADTLATGHYVRLRRTEDGQVEMLRAVDRKKDQSYVLHLLDQDQLQRSLFPVGGLPKAEIRRLAQAYGLSAAQQPDSQDLCFLSGNDYRDFLKRNLPETFRPGEICNLNGKVLGSHQGLANYTIGQRKGLGLTSPRPWYVIRKDVEHNRLIVGEMEDLGSSELTARAVNWISGTAPRRAFRAQVKVRYTAREVPAEVMPIDDGRTCRVVFEEPVLMVTPGQAAVFYNGDVVLGGGTISA